MGRAEEGGLGESGKGEYDQIAYKILRALREIIVDQGGGISGRDQHTDTSPVEEHQLSSRFGCGRGAGMPAKDTGEQNLEEP